MGLETGRPGQHEPPKIGYLGMVHSGVTIGLDQFVKRRGGNPARVARASGLQCPPSAIRPMEQTSEIPLSAFSSLLRSAADETRLPTFSVEFAEAFDVRSLGAIGYLFELAPDLGTALKNFCDAFELLQENTQIGVELHGDVARISYCVRLGSPEEKAPDAEFSVAMLGAALRQGHSGPSDVRRLDLEHYPDWEQGAAPTWLGTDFRPKSDCNAIFVKRSALDRPGRFNDAYLYGIVADRVFEELRNRSSRSDFVNLVVTLLKQAFTVGNFQQISAPSVAHQLGISVRMLHRQLAAYGVRFRDLKNSVMFDTAKLLLSDNRYSVTETALALGFSETSAFSRAFRQLSGLSPAQFRKSEEGS